MSQSMRVAVHMIDSYSFIHIQYAPCFSVEMPNFGLGPRIVFKDSVHLLLADMKH